MKKWTPEEIETLRERYPHEPTARLARELGRSVGNVYQAAARFGLAKSAEYLSSPNACRLRRGDNVGSACRFQKGHVPANKGLRRPGWAPGRMRETQFKKGSMIGAAQHNYVPIGSLRVSKDGYLERKVTDDHPVPARRWVGVHRLVWQDANGPIPDGMIVVFKPGMRSAVLEEITADKLECITRVEIMKRNTYHNLPQPLPKLVQLRGALNRKINRRERELEEQDGRPA